ncbi:hypothetical protein [Candidatus Tisiphia endosymbiont of Beris chalybata]|uniref:hypothetical protein n=1 Tax=Candidatus Tisiphia endosymbiont of Beris chalybata TaxID=3066262 RepID=UPI00312CA12A
MYPRILGVVNITSKSDNGQDLPSASANHNTDTNPIDFFAIMASTVLGVTMLLGGCVVILGVILKDSYTQYCQNKAINNSNLVAQVRESEVIVNTQELRAVQPSNSLIPLLSQNENHKQYNSTLHIIGEGIDSTHAESTI